MDWHWIFWINVPIGAVVLPVATRLLSESHGAPERLDLSGVTLLTGAVVAIVWAWFARASADQDIPLTGQLYGMPAVCRVPASC